MLSLLKINAVDSERMFLFLLSIFYNVENKEKPLNEEVSSFDWSCICKLNSGRVAEV